VEDDPNLAVATVVDTPEQLEQLFNDKFVYWEYAGFASVLVQRRADLRLLVAEHQSGFAPKTDRQITSIDELDQLVADMERELVRVEEGLEGHIRSASVRHVLGRESVTPEEVTAAAATIIDFYRDLLLVAKNTQAVVAPDDYREIIKNTAHLIDKPMEGIDQFITDWVGLVTMLPTLDGESYGEYHFHSIELTFEVDDDLLHRIRRKLKSRRQPWRRWLSPSAPSRREADAERQRQWATAEAERQRKAAAAEAERQRKAAAEAERQRKAAEQLRLKRQREEAEEERLRKAAVAEEKRAFQGAAAEAERRHTWQLTRWPKGTTLDGHIAQIDGFVRQVAAQNEKIESQVHHLNDLLHNGLREQPQGKPTAPYRAGDPKGITEHIELTLTAVQLGTEIPKARVAYSPQSRQLVVEYELPTVDVVPKAKSYHYVKSQDKVVETTRPASQVKGLYASAIAQLTLLCLARIFRVDTEQHIDVVVFNGVVDTIDLRTGKPIRPCLITVRTTRDTFSEIDLAHVEPVACLRYLNAGISRNPTDLAPVRPVLEFSGE
jgi:restriction system protein